MDIWLLTLFVATEFMFSLSPGPAVAAVVSSSIIGGYRLAIFAILGVLIGNLIYYIISAVLLSVGASASGDYFYYIRIAGCTYLIYLLYKQYIADLFTNKNKLEASLKIDTKRQNGLNKFIITFEMQISNPKTILFFTAFLPQFINTEYNLMVQFETFGILSFVTEFVVLIVYAAGGQAMLRYGSEHIGKYADHVGNVMMALAVIWSVFR